MDAGKTHASIVREKRDCKERTKREEGEKGRLRLPWHEMLGGRMLEENYSSHEACGEW